MNTETELCAQVFPRDYVNARWLFREGDIESPSDTGYRAACGVPGCKAYLGFLTNRRGDNAQLVTVDDVEAWHRGAAQNKSEPEWELVLPNGARGYRPEPGDLPWVYRVWRQSDAARNNWRRNAEREGRRPTPDMGFPGGVFGKREIIGNNPSPPCVIVCVECGAPNVVTVPQGVVD